MEGEAGVRLSRGQGEAGSRQRGERKGGWREAERRQKSSGSPWNVFLVPFEICENCLLGYLRTGHRSCGWSQAGQRQGP